MAEPPMRPDSPPQLPLTDTGVGAAAAGGTARRSAAATLGGLAACSNTSRIKPGLLDNEGSLHTALYERRRFAFPHLLALELVRLALLDLIL